MEEGCLGVFVLDDWQKGRGGAGGWDREVRRGGDWFWLNVGVLNALWSFGFFGWLLNVPEFVSGRMNERARQCLLEVC